MWNFKINVMKKHIKLLALILLIIACGTSCEEYLQNDESSTITDKNLFYNIDFAEKAVFNIYNSYGNYGWMVNLGAAFWGDNDVEFCYQNNILTYLGHYTNNLEANVFNELQWTYLYKAIEAANIVIDGLPKSLLWNGEDSKKARYLYGEAVALRAFTYSHLIFLYGDLPFYTEAMHGNSEFYPPKTDRDEIYEYLIQNLKDVEDYVPWMEYTGTNERVSKGFVKGLRAKLALHYAGYSLRNKTFETRRGRHWEEYLQIANQECREIMESGKHQLNPSFEKIFRDLHTNTMDMTYKEWMFCWPEGRDLSDGTWGTQPIGMATRSGVKYGSYNADTYRLITSPVYFYSFDKNDLRRDVAVAPYHRYSADASQHQVLQDNYCIYWRPSKWRKEWVEPSLAGQVGLALGIDIPVMRYADILLMFAETENEIKGPTIEAKEALSSVRQRAFRQEMWTDKVVQYVDSVSMSKKDFFNAIVDERAWEFGGELIRKPDLIRWNLFGSKVKEMKENFMHIIKDDDPKYAYIPNFVFWRYPVVGGDKIEILNVDYRLPDIPIDGYSKSGWISKMGSAWMNVWQNTYLPGILKGYNEAVNNHLYPIALKHISASRGVWENDQIP
jgi:hypothetical protein